MAPKPKQANRRANAKPKARTSVATEVAAPLDYQTVLGKVRSAPEPTAEDCSSAGVLFDHFPAGERKDNLRAWCGCLHGDGVCKKKTFVYVVTNADALGVTHPEEANARAKAKAKAKSGGNAWNAERIVENLLPHVQEHFQQIVENGDGLDIAVRCATAFGRLTTSHVWHLLAAKLDLQSPSDDNEFERKLRDFRACGVNYEPSIEDYFRLFRGKAPENHPHPLAFSDNVRSLNTVGIMMHRECDIGRRMASDLLREDPEEFHRLLAVADHACEGGGAVIVGGRGKIDWSRASKGAGKGFSAFSGHGHRLGE